MVGMKWGMTKRGGRAAVGRQGLLDSLKELKWGL